MKYIIRLLSSKILLIVSVISILFSGVAFAGTPVNETVDGVGNYYVTGQSYPTSIQIAGYNANTKTLYLDYSLETTNVAATQFNYYVQVFDGSGNMIGNYGSQSTPSTVAASSGKATVNYQQITLSTDLPANFSIVISVASVN